MDEVLVARIGKAHGLRGEVTVQVHTDEPDERFVVGATFVTEPRERGPLTVRTARLHNGIQLLSFEGLPDRTAAEGLRGVRLLAAPDQSSEDGWYADDLVGVGVFDTDGGAVGTVRELHTRSVQDLLEIEKTNGATVLVPLVEEIVLEIDLEGGRVVIDPPQGLLDLEV